MARDPPATKQLQQFKDAQKVKHALRKFIFPDARDDDDVERRADRQQERRADGGPARADAHAGYCYLSIDSIRLRE